MNEKLASFHITTSTAMIMATIMVAIMSVVMIVFGWIPHLALLLVICGLFIFGRSKGLTFDTMQGFMAKGVMSGFGAIYLFFFIGLMVYVFTVFYAHCREYHFYICLKG